jgi:hypothetical protein
MNTGKIVKVLITLKDVPTAQAVAEGDFADAMLKTAKIAVQIFL